MTELHPPEDLLEAARAAQSRAYAPYSRFHVGAAVRLADGSVVSAANVENASYGLSCCAERAAVFTAVAQGARELREVLVVADTDRPVPPCGACRQVLSEFLPADAAVWLVGRNGRSSRTTMGEILPGAFGPRDLGMGI
ncbi:MAG: cytidine deaminase [Thermaerobacter sp.]|nr:cytidine deaminase [Thermaerobacter sp.]